MMVEEVENVHSCALEKDFALPRDSSLISMEGGGEKTLMYYQVLSTHTKPSLILNSYIMSRLQVILHRVLVVILRN